MDFQRTLFQIGNKVFHMGHLASVILILILSLVTFYLINQILLPRYFKWEKVKTTNRKEITRIILALIAFTALLTMVWALDINYPLITTHGSWTINVVTLIEAVLILLFARLADWIISKVLLYNYQLTRVKGEPNLLPSDDGGALKLGSRGVQYAVYAFAVIFFLQNFPQLDRTILSFQSYNFKISNLFWAILILLVAQLAAWILTQLVLYRYYHNNKINVGSQFAINQLLKYLIYVGAVVMALDSLGIKMTVIWGGAAALLVGIGLGLQQTFNDLISGIILLFERTVEVGNVVDINGLVGTVLKIGLRTSIVETRDNITVIVPNSKLTLDKVINWSHFDDKARFRIQVGVAYGSDTALVKKILFQAAKVNVYVLDFPAPLVRLISFGESSLDFELLFWSANFIVIEDVKSDIRLEIDRLFRENNVTIPFPQRDVWMKK